MGGGAMPEQLRLQVLEHRMVAPGHFELVLPLERGMREAAPGQFVNIACRAEGALDPLLRRPFSVYWVEGDAFAVLYRVVGRGTRLLSQVKAGDFVDVVGPLGRGFDIEPFAQASKRGERLVLAGGGVGVPPLYFLSQRLSEEGIPFTVAVGFAGRDQIVAVDRWRARGVEPAISTVDGSAGRRGLVTDLLEEAFAAAAHDGRVAGVFACGPVRMLAAVARIAAERGVPSQVAMEEWMGCGLGVCLSCVTKVRGEGGSLEWARVCREGPVFDGAKVVWSA